MSEIDKLLEVQKLDTRIHNMERELRDIPARKEEEQTRLDEHKEALIAAQAQLKARQADLKDLELESHSREEKIQKLRNQQMALKTNKEFKAMEGEIAAVKREISGMEDGELELMEKIEAARQDVARREGELAEEQKAVDDDIAVLDERVTRIDAELQEVRAKREQAVTDVSPEWLSRYDAVISRRDTALVRLESGVCGGCHMQLPPYVVHATRKRDEMVTCDFCGRLLYY